MRSKRLGIERYGAETLEGRESGNEKFLMVGAVCRREHYSLGEVPVLPAPPVPASVSKGRGVYTPILEPQLKLSGYYLCGYIFAVTTPILVLQ